MKWQNIVSVSDIATYLNNNKYPTPSLLKKKSENTNKRINSIWTVSSVKKILKNRMYTGDMVQNLQTKLSYKSKKKVALEKDFWIIVPDTHEALVSKIVFESIQNNSKRTTKTFSKRDKRLFENLIFCKECGNTLTVTYRKNHNYWTVNCNKYARDPRRYLCEPHFMPYDKLENALLETIKKTCKNYLEKINIKSLATEINNSNEKTSDKKLEIRILEDKIKEYNSKIDMLYEDKFKGNISESTYIKLSKETEILLNQSKLRLDELKNNDSIKTDSNKKIKEYENTIRSLIDLENPTRELLQAIIEKIIIDKDKNIEIIYKFSLLNN